jgi:hypothetical protein
MIILLLIGIIIITKEKIGMTMMRESQTVVRAGVGSARLWASGVPGTLTFSPLSSVAP